MDIEQSKNARHMAPLLVRLYESHKLYALAGNDGSEARLELTNAVADLMEHAQTTPREQELIADILTGLVRQAERDLKEALAERLASMSKVPLRLVLQLAHEEISVARHVLTLSPVLSDLDLLYIIQSQTADYWQVIATRARMGDDVMCALADTRHEPTALALVENKAVRLPIKALEVIADLAKKSDCLQKPLLMREEIPARIAADLYPFVTQALKVEMEARFGRLDAQTIEQINDVATEFTSAGGENFKPTPTMIAAAQNMHNKGMLTVDLMVKTLKRGQIASFIAMMSAFSRLPVTSIENILAQPCGQGLAIICRAFGIGKVDFVGMFLLTQRYRAVSGVVDQGAMNKAVAYYERVKDDVAQRLIKGSQLPTH